MKTVSATYLLTIALVLLFSQTEAQSVSCFKNWIAGHDPQTLQLIPGSSDRAMVTENGKDVIHVRFDVKEYGEVSFSINPATPANTEALPVDLSKSRFVKIRYKANHPVLLQLREYHIHGGVQNHVMLPASDSFITRTVNLSSFKGGLAPLDLSNAAKFNFAFLGNNQDDGYADLVIESIKIDRYNPVTGK